MKFLLLPQVQLKAVVTLSRTSEHRCQLAWRCVMGPQQNVTIMVIDHCFPLSHHTLPKGWLLCFMIYLHSLPSAWSHNEPVISLSLGTAHSSLTMCYLQSCTIHWTCFHSPEGTNDKTFRITLFYRSRLGNPPTEESKLLWSRSHRF